MGSIPTSGTLSPKARDSRILDRGEHARLVNWQNTELTSQRKWFDSTIGYMTYKNKEAQKKDVKSKRLMVSKIKDVPCSDCGGKFPSYCMDFDHRNPKEKKYVIAWMPPRHGKKRILEEIAKCDIVCSNCHRIRTHKEKSAHLSQR